MTLDRTYDLPVPEIQVPATRVYAHATRMSDFDSPEIERILKPGFTLPAHSVRVEIGRGRSKTREEHAPPPSGPVEHLKQALKRVLHRRIPVVSLEDGVALDMRFLSMANFAHLVHDVLGPLRMIEEVADLEGRAVHVVLPKAAPPLAMRTLDAAGVPYIRTDGAVEGPLVTFSQDLNLCHLPNLVRQPFDSGDEPTPERVYVSRRSGRVVLNEAAVEAFLAERGYVRIFMEDLSIARQWATLAHARHVVGIHGAGLASLGFSSHRPLGAEPRFRLVELFSPGFASTCFRLYAAILGGRWVGVRGRVTPEVVRDLDVLGQARAHDQASFDVDLAALDEALDFAAREEPVHAAEAQLPE